MRCEIVGGAFSTSGNVKDPGQNLDNVFRIRFQSRDIMTSVTSPSHQVRRPKIIFISMRFRILKLNSSRSQVFIKLGDKLKTICHGHDVDYKSESKPSNRTLSL